MAEEKKNEQVEEVTQLEKKEEETKEVENVEETAPVKDASAENVFEALPECEENFNCEEYINETRTTFDNIMKSSRRTSTITMVAAVALLIGGFAMNTLLDHSLIWLSYVVFGLALIVIVVSFVFSSRGKKKIYGSVDDYVRNVIIAIDKYAFDQNGISQGFVSPKGKARLDDIVDAHYFATINNFNSRNIVKAYYKNNEFFVSELAVRIPYQKPLEDNSAEEPKSKKNNKAPTESFGIFGKYFAYPLKVEDDSSFMLVLRGPNACLPTYLDGYKEYSVSNLNTSYIVWVKNEEKAKKIFDNEEFIELLNGFAPNESLENIILSLNTKGLKVCLNYNESVMEIPMQKSVVGTPYVTYKENVRRVLDIIDTLSK